VTCTWTEPCNLPGCSRCERRHRFQAAKPVVLSASTQAVPLSILRGMSAPPIEPARLAELGPFLITHGRTRASVEDGLDLVSRRQVVLQVEPLSGELAGVPYCLYLVALDFRVQIVDLLRRTGGPVGPCLLTRHYLEPTVGVWSFCALEPDGELWDPFGVEQDPPGPGAAPVSFY